MKAEKQIEIIVNGHLTDVFYEMDGNKPIIKGVVSKQDITDDTLKDDVLTETILDAIMQNEIK